MVAFNPQVPKIEEQPTYFKPIETPRFISATGEAVKDIAEGVTGGIKAADQIVQAFAADDVRRTVEPERENYIQALRAGNAVSQLQASGTLTDALPEGQQGPLPPPIKQLPQQLGVLQSARAGGKLSETDYYARLMALAKDLRSRYPIGYSYYIDSKISAITGVDPANAYIKSVIGDINSRTEAVQKQKNAVSSMILKNADDYPELVPVYIAHQKGQLSDEAALMEVSKRTSVGAAIKRRELELNAQKGEEEAAQRNWYNLGRDKASHIFNTNADNMTVPVDGGSPVKLFEALSSSKPSGTQALDLARGLGVLGQKTEADINAWLDTKDSDGRSYRSKLAPGKDQEIIKEVRDRTQFQIDKLTKGEASPYLMAKSIWEAQNSEALRKSFEQYPWLRGLKTIEASGGSQFLSTFVTQQMLGNTSIQKDATALLTKGVIDGALGEPTSSGAMPSLIKSYEESKEHGINTPQHYRNYLKILDAIVDPNISPDLRQKYAAYFFREENRPIIRMIEEDSIGSDGKKRTSRTSFFQQLTSDRLLQATKELGGAAWEQHKDWATSTFSQHLLEPAVVKLNSEIEQHDIKWGWDETNNHLTYVIKNPATSPMDRFSGKLYRDEAVRFTVNNLNRALDRLKPIAKADGEDLNKYMLEYLLKMRMDPSIMKDFEEGHGLQILKALAKSKATSIRDQE
jgi:hypothetical protein